MTHDKIEDRVCDGKYMLPLTGIELYELNKRLEDYIEYRRWEDGPGNFFYDNHIPRRDQRAMVGAGDSDFTLNQARKKARMRKFAQYNKENRDEIRRRRYENYRLAPSRDAEGHLQIGYASRTLAHWPIGAEEGLARYLSHMTASELDAVRPMLERNPNYESLKPTYERVYGTKSVGCGVQPVSNG